LRGLARRKMQELWEANEAAYRSRLLDAVSRAGGTRLLDVGCDDGEWTSEVAACLGSEPSEVTGIEIVEEPRTLAQARGYDVRAADLGQPWPFDDETFDVVHANQVIEHVHRLDHFVGEIRRVLAPGGAAVICTENLASWHNVGAVALGYMPFSLTNISQRGVVGNPFGLHDGEDVWRPESWQHVHVLTLDGLRSIFELHGFVVEEAFGTGYYPAWGRAGEALARRDPRHAHFIGVLARRS
jgi:SAM-dependent methyltransferase